MEAVSSNALSPVSRLGVFHVLLHISELTIKSIDLGDLPTLMVAPE